MFILTEAAHSSGVLEGVVHLIVPEIIGLIEIMGIIVIIVGSIKGFYMYASSLISGKHYPIKLALGNSLALGLEFKMGAEILKTVTIRTIDEIMILLYLRRNNHFIIFEIKLNFPIIGNTVFISIFVFKINNTISTRS